jgi:uncharacterized membrane protein
MKGKKQPVTEYDFKKILIWIVVINIISYDIGIWMGTGEVAYSISTFGMILLLLFLPEKN